MEGAEQGGLVWGKGLLVSGSGPLRRRNVTVDAGAYLFRHFFIGGEGGGGGQSGDTIIGTGRLNFPHCSPTPEWGKEQYCIPSQST